MTQLFWMLLKCSFDRTDTHSTETHINIYIYTIHICDIWKYIVKYSSIYTHTHAHARLLCIISTFFSMAASWWLPSTIREIPNMDRILHRTHGNLSVFSSQVYMCQSVLVLYTWILICTTANFNVRLVFFIYVYIYMHKIWIHIPSSVHPASRWMIGRLRRCYFVAPWHAY